MNCMVTGVSRGIGFALAAELTRQGHAVWGLSRTPPTEEPGGLFRHLVCDVADKESRNQAGNEMDAAGYLPDVVILNAAIEYEEDKAALSWERMKAVLRTNVEGSLYWVSHWMDQRPRRPLVFVGISSLQALWPDADCPAYCASKAALAMAFRAFRQRYAKDPVTFKLLYLGPVHTSINPRFVQAPKARGVSTPEAVARYLVNTVLSKRGLSSYYPWTAGLVARFGAWMPDRLFEGLTRPFRR